MRERVLIVDDEPLVCKSLSELVKRSGYETHTANNGYEALEAIQQNQFSVVVTDMSMPKMNGLEVLQKAKLIVPNIAVIIITGYATVESAVEAMKFGAYDYITKPFSQDKIETVIENAIASIPCQSPTRYAPAGTISSHSQYDIITSDPQMLDILDRIKLIAQTDSTVLIQGESGTGKELIARAIHRCSRRSGRAFVAVNCAALPEGLVESELFGHEKGAFTGAIIRRIGKLELAHGGSILLDEVSEMAKPLQAKLLRTLQEREIVRLGGTQTIKVDVRIIATTNTDLVEEVDKGNFREDLFYRLCVVPVLLPPLRERVGDIPILANYFVQKFSKQMGKKASAIAQKTMEILENYSWPGNVRELENTIERAIALSQNGAVSLDGFFARKISSKSISLRIGTSLKDAEKELILRTLEEVGGNRQKTADILGITSKTIRAKLRQYHGEDPEATEDSQALEKLNFF